jgi:type III secretory pathway lipoprotein EscJ
VLLLHAFLKVKVILCTSKLFTCVFCETCLTGQMDLETENRIAAMLMREAAELRRQADKEGVHVYLRQPKARFRPNSRFLTATVLGVQQG